MEIKGTHNLVIGGAGFIGSHVVEQLLKEDIASVTIYDNFCRGTLGNIKDSLKDPRVNLFMGDIMHPDILNHVMQGIDCVYHLAALWLLHCYEYPRSAFQVNIEGTFNVLEACVKNNIKKLVYSSSASVYGDALYTPMDESHPYNNKTFYGATKIASEHMCEAFHHRYGLNYVALRYMNVYGPRQDYKGAYTTVIMKTIDNILNGKPPEIHGDGTQSFDFVYVDDVARANVYAMKSPEIKGFYNVGTGVGVDINTIVQDISHIMRKNLEPEYIDAPTEQGLVINRVGKMSKAIVCLGYLPKVGLIEGLAKIIDWRMSNESTID